MEGKQFHKLIDIGKWACDVGNDCALLNQSIRIDINGNVRLGTLKTNFRLRQKRQILFLIVQRITWTSGDEQY